MATRGFQQGKLYFLRYRMLVEDVGTQVLLRLFEAQILKEQGLKHIRHYLYKSKNYILSKLNAKQQGLLYPPDKQDSDINSCDITVLCILLNNCCKHLSKDAKIAIDCIKDVRNNIAHLRMKELKESEFNTEWRKLENALLDILKELGDVRLAWSLKDEIRRIKEDPLANQDLIKDSFCFVKRVVSESEGEATLDEKIIELRRFLQKEYGQYTQYTNVPVQSYPLRVADVYVERTYIDSVERSKQFEGFQSIFSSAFEASDLRHIVLVGSAGYGKTTFCLQIVNSWCSGIKKLESNSALTPAEQYLTSMFDLIFYIPLRICEQESRVFEMIKSKLLNESQDKIEHVKALMEKRQDKCLVILDGIDEWHSSKNALPDFCNLSHCKILWTTRHSKDFLFSTLKSKMMFELCELGTEQTDKLITTIAERTCKQIDVEKRVIEIKSDLEKYKIGDITNNPLYLTFLALVRVKNNEMKDSKTGNYCQILIYLLEHFKIDDSQGSKVDEKTRKLLPFPLQISKHAVENSMLLFHISAFASKYTTQNMFVFSADVVKQELGDTYEECIKVGLLFEIKQQNQCSNQGSVQFFHRTMQELLTALFIYFKDVNYLEDFLRTSCNTQSTLMEMSTVLCFVCGFCPEKAQFVFGNINKVVAADKDLEFYRNSLQGRYTFRNPCPFSSYQHVRNLQQLSLDCQKEVDVCTAFFSMKKIRTVHGQIFATGPYPTNVLDLILADTVNKKVEDILRDNKKFIRSLYIDLPNRVKSPDFLWELIPDMENVQRLHLEHNGCSKIIYRLNDTQLNRIRSLTLTDVPSIPPSLNNVTALSLSLSGTHESVQNFAAFLKTAKSIQELRLEGIICDEHKRNSNCVYEIDLSNTVCLKYLKIEKVVSKGVYLPLTVKLEYLWFSTSASKPETFIGKLPGVESLTTVVLGDFTKYQIWTDNDYKVVSANLLKLQQVNFIYLIGMDFESLENVYLSICPSKQLKLVSLESIRLCETNWISLLTVLAGCTTELRVMGSNLKEFMSIVCYWNEFSSDKIVLDLNDENIRKRVKELHCVLDV